MDALNKENLLALTQEFKNKVLGLIFDGWNDGIDNHYCGIFICYEHPRNGETVFRLIAVAPLFDVPKLDADTHISFVKSKLECYELTTDSISFIVADNCSTNTSIGRKLKIPLIGCTSHRLNLAIQKFYGELNPQLDRIHEIMKKLKLSL